MLPFAHWSRFPTSPQRALAQHAARGCTDTHPHAGLERSACVMVLRRTLAPNTHGRRMCAFVEWAGIDGLTVSYGLGSTSTQPPELAIPDWPATLPLSSSGAPSKSRMRVVKDPK